jgi:POT family proton-dependent oligopeptide transporter
MTVGYLLIAIPMPNLSLYLPITCSGLFMIVIGGGLFKGNLQAVVGQMYDNTDYAKMRDAGFTWFCVFLNIGTLFAPLVAVALHNRYGFHSVFGISVIAMLISLIIYGVNEQKFPDASLASHSEQSEEFLANNTSPKPSPNEREQFPSFGEVRGDNTRQRFYALFYVFAVMNLFYFAFYQDGLTLTFFARDYTDFSLNIGKLDTFFFILLAPVVLAIFGFLRTKGKEPSTLKKIAIGMGIATIAYIIMAVGSIGLPNSTAVYEMGGLPETERVTLFLVIGTCFVLTLATVFIAPLLISFVSKISPPKYQGTMQSLLLLTGGFANSLLFLGSKLYGNISIWMMWVIFASVCLISMAIMLLIMKKIEKVGE